MTSESLFRELGRYSCTQHSWRGQVAHGKSSEKCSQHMEIEKVPLDTISEANSDQRDPGVFP